MNDPTRVTNNVWQLPLEQAISLFLSHASYGQISNDHIKDTPMRVSKAFASYVRGYEVDPAIYLKRKFRVGKYDEMVHLDDIVVKSLCAHHLCPIIGTASFAYIPKKSIVGLSKIPRMIDALARRLQVQEDLTEQIVDLFQSEVRPLGCAVSIRAVHFCMMFRGIEEPFSTTKTTALRGVFKKSPETRAEFLQNIASKGSVLPWG